MSDKNNKINDLEIKLKKKEELEKKAIIKLDDDTAQREKQELFNRTWGEVSGKILSGIYHAWQMTEKAINPDDGLPHTSLQKMALDIGECRDKLTEVLELLPSDTAPIDTGWLTEDNKEI